MSYEASLFPDDNPLDLDAEVRKLAKRHDPETSKQAARQIVTELGRLHEEVIGMLELYPGETVSELALRFELRDPRHIGRRLPELARLGRVRRGQARTCRVTGRAATTWLPTEETG